MDNKRILSIDTSGRACSVAVSCGEKICASEYMDTKMTMHSRTVMKMVDHVLKRAELSVQDIDIFAANVGPGSFTGVRIGICTVKGLAKAAGKKVFSADALDVLAVGAGVGAKRVLAMIDAGRGEAYYAVYENGVKTNADAVADVRTIAQAADAGTVLVGDGAVVYQEEMEQYAAGAVIAHLAQTRADHVCMLAAAAKEGDLTEPELMTANYIRESGAVRKKYGDQ